MADDLGNDLRHERRRQALTLEQLAERSGLTPRTIGSIERGVGGAPLARTLTALADALGISGDARTRLLSQAREHRRAGLEVTARSELSPHRLPDFAGRSRELAELATATPDVSTRTVVISGMGGVGKTSLAVHASAQLDPTRDRFFVDLDGLGGAPLTPLQVFQALLGQVAEDAAAPTTLEAAAEAWRTSTQGSFPVVILDSARDAEHVQAIVESTGSGDVLITSRRPLSELTPATSIRLGVLALEEALALLRHIIPAAQRDEESLVALATLSGCVPLALRIMANRIASRPHETAARVVERAGSEERRLRTLVAGDLSIEATFSLSYADLRDDLAQVFRSLGVIEGTTFDEHIAAAATGADPTAVSEELDELVDLGLLEIRGGHRYRLHDLLRLYATRKLIEDEGEAARDAAARRLRAWLLRSLERAGAWFESERDATAPVGDARTFQNGAEAKRWLMGEADHWWSAYQSAATSGQHEAVIDAADALHWFSDLWMGWGHWHEFYKTSSESAIALEDPREQARHLGYLAWAELVERLDPEAAGITAERALDAAERADDDEQRGWAQYYRAWAARRLGANDRALDHIDSAVRSFSRSDNREALTQAMFMAGIIRGSIGDVESGLNAYEELLASVVADRARQDSLVLVFAQVSLLSSISDAYRALGRAAEALQASQSGFTIAEEFDMRLGMALSLSEAALAHRDLHDEERARDTAERAIELVSGDDSFYAGRIREELEVFSNA